MGQRVLTSSGPKFRPGKVWYSILFEPYRSVVYSSSDRVKVLPGGPHNCMAWHRAQCATSTHVKSTLRIISKSRKLPVSSPSAFS